MTMKKQQILGLTLGLFIGFPVFAMPLLHEAVVIGDSEKVRQILTPEFEINQKDSSGMTALQLAVREQNMEIIELLVDSGADVNLPSTRFLFTPLHISIRTSFAMSKFLIDHGADINQKNSEGASPLHIAARAGNNEMVEFLIANGADVNSEDSEDYTPLHNAAWNGHLRAVEMLVSSGADINASTYTGDTPYNCAAGKNHDDVTAFLERLGVVQ